MSQPLELDRFGGIARLYGIRGLERFAQAHVAVVGVGGVGSWCVEALARSGIGRLTLIDLDDICISNSNRQLHTLGSTLGRSKVEVLRERVADIAPHCQCEVQARFVTTANVAECLPLGLSAVIDAIDHTAVKAAIVSHALSQNLPIAVSGSAGGRTDPSAVRVADLGRCGADPLLGALRRQLRKQYPDCCPSQPAQAPLWQVPCVYSTQAALYPQPDGSCSAGRPTDQPMGLKLDCASGLGACTAVTGTFGFMLSAMVLERLSRALP